MNTEEYHKMHALERDYWWHQGRRRLVLSMVDSAIADLRGEHVRWSRTDAPGASARGAKSSSTATLKPGQPPRLLDVGCGTGALLEHLSTRGIASGLDFSPLALKYCGSHGLARLGRADASQLPLKSDSYDILTAIDLIEHVEADASVVSEFFRILAPGGCAVMSVPAHKALWSPHDVALHHFRRYSRAQFHDLVVGPGFEILKYGYSMASVLPPAFAVRVARRAWHGNNAGNSASAGTRAQASRGVWSEARDSAGTDDFAVPGPINAALRALVYAEADWLASGRSLPFGLSLLCVARKPVGQGGAGARSTVQ